jgi:hypothetical protein
MVGNVMKKLPPTRALTRYLVGGACIGIFICATLYLYVSERWPLFRSLKGAVVICFLFVGGLCMAFTPFYLIAYTVGLVNNREMAKTCAIVVALYAALAATFLTESGNFLLQSAFAALGQLLR